MRIHSIITLSLATAALAACDTADHPTAVFVHSRPRVFFGAAPLVISPFRTRIPFATTARLFTNAPVFLLTDLIWTSSQPSIVVVQPDGTIIAIGPGVAIITVSFASDPFFTATAFVEVAPPFTFFSP